MKKFLIIFLLLSFYAVLMADEPFWIKCKKQYVKPYQLQICDEGIFANIDGYLIRINNIQYDKKGISFSEIDYNSRRWGLTYWLCPKCDFKNSTFDKVCKNCKYNPSNLDKK